MYKLKGHWCAMPHLFLKLLNFHKHVISHSHTETIYNVWTSNHLKWWWLSSMQLHLVRKLCCRITFLPSEVVRKRTCRHLMSTRTTVKSLHTYLLCRSTNWWRWIATPDSRNRSLPRSVCWLRWRVDPCQWRLCHNSHRRLNSRSTRASGKSTG